MTQKRKNIIIIIALSAIGVALILFGSISFGDKGEESVSIDYKSYTQELEKKIEGFLLSIEGIKRANVIITLDTSNERVYAQNQSTYDFLTISSDKGESPVYITEIYPTVRGVAIACTGGDGNEIKMKLTRLVSAYLGISSNRIEIVGIK